MDTRNEFTEKLLPLDQENQYTALVQFTEETEEGRTKLKELCDTLSLQLDECLTLENQPQPHPIQQLLQTTQLVIASKFAEECLTLTENEQYNLLLTEAMINISSGEKNLKHLKHYLNKQTQDHATSRLLELIDQAMAASELLLDPIYCSDIKDAYLTPQGTTYDKKILELCEMKDPQTREILTEHSIRPNLFFNAMREFMLEAQWNKKNLLKLFSCPLSDEVFIDPVTAQDGITYERNFIETYLSNHDALTPQGIKQTSKLYPNRMIEMALARPYLKQLIQTAQEELTLNLSKDSKELLQLLDNYIKQRLGENDYHSWIQSFSWIQKIFRTGYNKSDKIIGATQLKKILKQGELPSLTFFNSHEYNVFKQGRLKNLIPIDHFLCNEKTSIKISC